MTKLRELEKFYEAKVLKEDLVAAVNSVNAGTKKEFEGVLKSELTLRDYIFTFLSNIGTVDNFLYLWNSFSQEPSDEVILPLAHKVVKDEFDKKSEVGIAIRHVLSAKQKMEAVA